MSPRPKPDHPSHRGSGKLEGRVALITGADSGIARAVAVAFAKEGARVTVAYLNEHEDAKETKRLVEENGGQALLVAGDVGDEAFCKSLVDATLKEFGKLDILVNNAGEASSHSRVPCRFPSPTRRSGSTASHRARFGPR